ncbi:MAG: hypothetical protein IJG23_05625 [Clostridia bacterium]|nr:hypothetical protein [Clostridia bacterium]
MKLKTDYRAESQKHYAAIAAYIDLHFIEEKLCAPMPSACAAIPAAPQFGTDRAARPLKKENKAAGALPRTTVPADLVQAEPETSSAILEAYLEQVKDESFSEMLLRLIDEKGMKDAECYKKANVDKRLFSKIRSNPLYKPGKQTALAFIFALELPYEQACEMLKKAGYAFSPANKADLICEYYIKQGIYNLFIVNQSLFDFDQPLIGSF